MMPQGYFEFSRDGECCKAVRSPIFIFHINLLLQCSKEEKSC